MNGDLVHEPRAYAADFPVLVVGRDENHFMAAAFEFRAEFAEDAAGRRAGSRAILVQKEEFHRPGPDILQFASGVALGKGRSARLQGVKVFGVS